MWNRMSRKQKKVNRKRQLFNLAFVACEMNSNWRVFNWEKELLSPLTVSFYKTGEDWKGKEKSCKEIIKLDVCKGLHEKNKQNQFSDIRSKGVYSVGIKRCGYNMLNVILIKQPHICLQFIIL